MKRARDNPEGPAPVASLADMSLDVLRCVLSLFSYRDRLSLGQTCRRLHDAAHHPSFWKTLTIPHIEGNTFSSQVGQSVQSTAALLRLHAGDIEHLTIESPPYQWEQEKESLPSLMQAISSLGQLRVLVLLGFPNYGSPDPVLGTAYEKKRKENAPPDLFEFFTKSFEKKECRIERIHILFRCHCLSGTSFINFLNIVQPPLEHLTLNYCFVHVRNYKNLFQALRKVGKNMKSFTCDAFLRDDDLGQNIVDCFPNLQELHIPHFITKFKPLSSLPQLIILEISNNETLDLQKGMVLKHFTEFLDSQYDKLEGKELGYDRIALRPNSDDLQTFTRKITKEETFKFNEQPVDLYYIPRKKKNWNQDAVTVFFNTMAYVDNWGGEGIHWGLFVHQMECTLDWMIGTTTIPKLHQFYKEAGLKKDDGKFCGEEEED